MRPGTQHLPAPPGPCFYLVLVVILGLLALLIWTQRASLQECSDNVRAASADIDDPNVDTTCSFLGRDVQITLALGS